MGIWEFKDFSSFFSDAWVIGLLFGMYNIWLLYLVSLLLIFMMISAVIIRIRV
ncbi:MAG: hypothetical protein P8H17_03845 [Flavobacteriales bacterium]|nr:hypothetical protein [Flavobacteriales bacterium]